MRCTWGEHERPFAPWGSAPWRTGDRLMIRQMARSGTRRYFVQVRVDATGHCQYAGGVKVRKETLELLDRNVVMRWCPERQSSEAR